jgi:hypothetical protein
MAMLKQCYLRPAGDLLFRARSPENRLKLYFRLDVR